MLHPDPLSLTLAIIGLLIFIRLSWKSKKHLARPFFATTELFVVILKESPYDFEDNKIFDTKRDADTFKDSLPKSEDYKSEAIETALDKIKTSYFNKGFEGVSAK